MPSYNDLRPDDDEGRRDYALVFRDFDVEQRKRTIQNLLTLRQALGDQVIPKRADQNLLIASWNIKELGHTTQRRPEAFFYMAEIIARFDLVIIQEIKSKLDDLHILMKLLGDDWAYLVNDITEGTDGNSERSGYIYNKRRVEFAGLAGEIVLWDSLTAGSSLKQLKRTPYITGFRAGWKTFAIINVHLHPSGGQDDQDLRAEEVKMLLAAIAEKKKQGGLWNENLILAGDFNFYEGKGTDKATIAAIREAGFREVESLVGQDTNASLTEVYDRLFLTDNEYFEVGKGAGGVENGGVFRLFDVLYRNGEEAPYRDWMLGDYTGSSDLTVDGKLAKYFKHPWRKNQLSDHFPIWFELVTDSAGKFLERTLNDY